MINHPEFFCLKEFKISIAIRSTKTVYDTIDNDYLELNGVERHELPISIDTITCGCPPVWVFLAAIAGIMNLVLGIVTQYNLDILFDRRY